MSYAKGSMFIKLLSLYGNYIVQQRRFSKLSCQTIIVLLPPLVFSDFSSHTSLYRDAYAYNNVEKIKRVKQLVHSLLLQSN